MAEKAKFIRFEENGSIVAGGVNFKVFRRCKRLLRTKAKQLVENLGLFYNWLCVGG